MRSPGIVSGGIEEAPGKRDYLTAGRSRKDLQDHLMEKKEETKRCNESGIEAKLLYTREDLQGLDPETQKGFPTQNPFGE